jgi:hypothetical protein
MRRFPIEIDRPGRGDILTVECAFDDVAHLRVVTFECNVNPIGGIAFAEWCYDFARETVKPPFRGVVLRC